MLYLPSQKARQLILPPKSPTACIYVYMSVTVSYGHLARGLKIVSVAIPMTSSCSIYDAVEAHSCVGIVAKFTDEQYTTINQSTAGCFDPRVFVIYVSL